MHQKQTAMLSLSQVRSVVFLDTCPAPITRSEEVQCLSHAIWMMSFLPRNARKRPYTAVRVHMSQQASFRLAAWASSCCNGSTVRLAWELTRRITKKPRMPKRMLTAATMMGIQGLGVPRKGEGFSAFQCSNQLIIVIDLSCGHSQATERQKSKCIHSDPCNFGPRQNPHYVWVLWYV